MCRYFLPLSRLPFHFLADALGEQLLILVKFNSSYFVVGAQAFWVSDLIEFSLIIGVAVHFMPEIYLLI